MSANLTTQYDVQFTPGGAFFEVLNSIGYPLRLRMRGDLGWANRTMDHECYSLIM